MKIFLTLIIFSFVFQMQSQSTTQYIGVTNIQNLNTDNSATDILALQTDGTLVTRNSNSISNGLTSFPGNKDETIRYDGSNWVANNLITNTGINVGIGNQNPVYILDVMGDIRIGKPSTNLGSGRYIHDTKLSTNSGYTVFRLLLDHIDASQSSNMFFGSDGPNSTIPGSYGNLGIGGFTLRKLNTGYNNIAIGNGNQINTTDGIMNTSIGVSSLFFNKIGNQNVALGANAGYNCLGDRNIFIGYQAGLNETGSDKLYIQNISYNPPLIYGEFDNKLIQINGQLHVEDLFKLKPTSAPSNPAEGMIYYDGTLKKVRVWTGTSWENLN